MLKRIIDFLPNVHNCEHDVLLYHNYHFVEKYPSTLVVDESALFCDMCSMIGLELPQSFQFAYFRSSLFSVKIRDYGEYQLIILKPKKLCTKFHNLKSTASLRS